MNQWLFCESVDQWVFINSGIVFSFLWHSIWVPSSFFFSNQFLLWSNLLRFKPLNMMQRCANSDHTFLSALLGSRSATAKCNLHICRTLIQYCYILKVHLNEKKSTFKNEQCQDNENHQAKCGLALWLVNKVT